MRFIFGVIIGIVLTIGGVYVIDMMHSAPGPNQQVARRMVNWDVVNDDMRGFSTQIQNTWARLTGKPVADEKRTGT